MFAVMMHDANKAKSPRITHDKENSSVKYYDRRVKRRGEKKTSAEASSSCQLRANSSVLASDRT
ncbi:hypothetical protein ACHAWF_006003 [Thalassiosira exigua]